ncbi:MAG: Ig-like domain-containing protein [Chloroflexota bacterium]
MKKFTYAVVSALLATMLIVTAASALFFNNGTFETGSWTPGWDGAGQREFLLFDGGYDGTGFPNLSAGGADLSAIVPPGGAPALSVADPNTNNLLLYPAYGNYSARINSQDSYSSAGYGRNANTLYQTTVVEAADVDAGDGKVHLRMMYAAVLVEPSNAHTIDEVPMFFLEVKDETAGTIIFHDQAYVNDPGHTWNTGAAFVGGGTWYFTDWQLVDTIAGDGSGPNSIVGHTVSVKVVGSGCSLSGHPGYIYVDEIGSSHVGGPAIVASGPATRNTGQTITYTYDYFNGDSATIDANVTVNPPVGVTFTSVADPNCTLNGGGDVTCTFASLAGNTGGQFTIDGTVTAVGPATINHGNYNIGATGYPTVTGPVVVTDVPAAPANNPPVANDDVYSTSRNVTLNGTTVLVNDTDADLDPLTAVLGVGPTHASAFTLNADGTFTYTPSLNYTGQDTFTYFANDGTENSAAPATVTIDITANDPPVIGQGASSNITMSEDAKPVPFGPLTLTATDLNGDPLTWSILTPPAYGTASIDPVTGVVSYKPKLNYNTDSHANTPDDSFVAQVDDGNGGTATHTVNLTITPVSDPFILNQAFRITYNGWKHLKDVQAVKGGYRTATTGFFRAKPVMPFTTFTLISYTGPDQGQARVTIDGVNMGTVDLYSPAPQYKAEFAFPGLANGQHMVVIQPLGTKNAASTGTNVRVDALKFNTTTFDENMVDNKKIDMWYGSWLGQTDANAEHNAYRISSVKDGNMLYTWVGVEITWLTALGPSYGKAEIYVDGVLNQTVDLYAATQTWQHPITISGLTYGRHTIRIHVLGTKRPASSGTGVVMDGLDFE